MYKDNCTKALADIEHNMLDKCCICIWPDATWCYENQLEEYRWKSDDFRAVYVDLSLTPEELEDQVTQGLL
jgi:hypothetical protein